jgi:hypothetical protein
MEYSSQVAHVLERIGRGNIFLDACFAHFRITMVMFVVMVGSWETSLNRTRRAASNDVIFESGIGSESNIPKKYFL